MPINAKSMPAMHQTTKTFPHSFNAQFLLFTMSHASSTLRNRPCPPRHWVEFLPSHLDQRPPQQVELGLMAFCFLQPALLSSGCRHAQMNHHVAHHKRNPQSSCHLKHC